MRKTKLPSGEELPVLGQGTWGFGEHPENRHNEIDALRFGIDVGMTLIDTAEMYGDGAAEELIGKAIEGRREQTFIVDKVLHRMRRGNEQSRPARTACAASRPTASICTCCTGAARYRWPKRWLGLTTCYARERSATGV